MELQCRGRLNFESANVSDFDPPKSYNVYWKGNDTM